MVLIVKIQPGPGHIAKNKYMLSINTGATYHEVEVVVERKSGDQDGNSPGDEAKYQSLVDRHYSPTTEHVVHTNKPEQILYYTNQCCQCFLRNFLKFSLQT